MFDTADDTVYDLRLASTYSTGSTIALRIYDGPLHDGNYQLTVRSSLTDVVGNPLDGDPAQPGGDDYLRTFTVDLPDGFVYEGQSNGTLATATPLPLTENPVDSGLFLTQMFGLGSIDPSSDLDWWSFQAEAGDRVGIAVDTPGSGIAVGLRLYNSGGSQITSGFGAGPDNDGYISHYLVPTTGTYYVRLERWTNDSIGSYELRVELARGIDLESDQSYNNDSFAGADLVALTQSGNQRSGTVAGTIMDREGTNVDGDRFQLGLLNVNNVIDLSLTLPSSSTLVPLLRVFDDAGVELLDEDGDASNGFQATVISDGDYYAQVSNDYWVYNGRAYDLLGSLNWNNSRAAAQALGGDLVTIDDAAEQSFLQRAFGGWSTWIGLHDADGSNTFVWADGTPVSYTNWNSGEPNTSSYDGAYKSTNGLWYDYPKTSALNGIAEWADPQGRSYAGPGPCAQYVLDVTITDFVPPRVTGVSRFPNGGVTSQLISTFNVTVSEDLKASTVNTPVYVWGTYNGKTYVRTPTTRNWSSAQSFAQSLGGNLITINDAAEQDFLRTTFGNLDAWLGLNDLAVQGDYEWVDGTSFDDKAGETTTTSPAASRTRPATGRPTSAATDSGTTTLIPTTTCGAWWRFPAPPTAMATGLPTWSIRTPAIRLTAGTFAKRVPTGSLTVWIHPAATT